MRFAAALLFLVTFVCCETGCHSAGGRKVSARKLQNAQRNGEKFVLVFGSVKALNGGRDVTYLGSKDRAALRFVHNSPVSTLLDLPIGKGERFFALLRPAEGERFLGNFSLKVRWLDAEFDELSFARLTDRPGFAFYVGEVEMTVADENARRATARQILSVNLRDEFADACAELKKRYPGFSGEMVPSAALRARPIAAPPQRKR